MSLILFVSKWYPFILSQKNLTIEFMFNYAGDGKYWIPYIKFLSELTLNNSFDPNTNNLKILPIPFGSLFIYSILFKFFNLQGLVLAELLAIFLFLSIFFKLFSQITSEINSLIFALVMLSFPELINLVDVDNNYINNLSFNFFSFRPHRPIFSNIFFYFCIYLLLRFMIEKEFNKKNFYFFSFFLGFTFSSFYYFFLILAISFLFILIHKANLIKFLKGEQLTIIKSICFFILASLPFIIILLSHEKDVSTSAGLISLNFEQKIILFKYYLSVFIDYKFLIIFIIITFCTFSFRGDNKKANKLILLSYIIFLSSLLSPLLFVLVSPRSGLIYHFNNNIILTSFLFFLFLFFFKIIDKIKIKKLNLSIILISILLFNVYFKIKSNFEIDKINNSNQLIKEFSIITENIKNNFGSEIKNVGLLTFESDFMIWGILNNIKYFNILNHMWVPKDYNLIEEDLINSLKFLNIKEKGFKTFFKNHFMDWRYFNSNVAQIFLYRYQANSLTTKKNFDFESSLMKEFIINSSPSLNQQIAIHNSEIKRLTNKYKSETRNYFRKPEIIIINNNKDFLKDYIVDDKMYCIKFKGFHYSLYYLLEKKSC